MERETTTKDEYKFIGLFMAVVVTIEASLKTLERWHKLDGMGKSLAILLLISLVTTPIGIIRKEKRGQPGNAYTAIFAAYMLVMIAIMAFTYTIK
jgi:hypothetical protein